MSKLSVNPKYIASTAAALLAAVATFGYLSTSFVDQQRMKRNLEELEKVTAVREMEIKDRQRHIDESAARVDAILSQISSARGKAPDSPESLRQIALLREDISSVKNDVSALHSGLDGLNMAITMTPEKALTVPLLRKDLEDFKGSTQRDIDSIRGEMTRGYDLNKWLIGLILAAVLGTVISSALQSRQSNRHQSPRFE